MRRLVAVSVLAVFVAACLTGSSGASEASQRRVFPRHSHPYEISYREWAADWFEWLVEAPLSTSPLLNPDNCGPGESGRVWFLSVSLGGASTANCTVPAGKAILVTPGGAFCTPAVGDPQTTYAGLRRCALGEVRTLISGVRVVVDGHRIKHVLRHLVVSRLIHLHLPSDNVFGAAAGSYPAVVVGYFLILHPLSLGHHTIATFDNLGGTPTSMTYDITVVP